MQVSPNIDETWCDGCDVRGDSSVDVRRWCLSQRGEHREQENAPQTPPFGRLIGGTMLFMR